MTVRELVQTLLIESPNLDADTFISFQKDKMENENYSIVNISNYGVKNNLFIEIKKEC